MAPLIRWQLVLLSHWTEAEAPPAAASVLKNRLSSPLMKQKRLIMAPQTAWQARPSLKPAALAAVQWDTGTLPLQRALLINGDVSAATYSK